MLLYTTLANYVINQMNSSCMATYAATVNLSLKLRAYIYS